MEPRLVRALTGQQTIPLNFNPLEYYRWRMTLADGTTFKQEDEPRLDNGKRLLPETVPVHFPAVVRVWWEPQLTGLPLLMPNPPEIPEGCKPRCHYRRRAIGNSAGACVNTGFQWRVGFVKSGVTHLWYVKAGEWKVRKSTESV